jgi:RNA polymerase sigma factor (sigma-70 family)
MSNQIDFNNAPGKSNIGYPINPTENQHAIWIEFLGGSNKALAELYKIYSKKLYVYGRQFTHCDEQIYDTIQDVFIYLTESRDKLSIAKSVKQYLFAVFRRMLLQALEKERKLVSGKEVDYDGFHIVMNNEFFAVGKTLDQQQKKLIENACNRLPVRQREMLILRFFEGMSYSEIADTMGLANSKTVRTMMYRSYHRLSDLLSPYKNDLTAFFIAVSYLRY